MSTVPTTSMSNPADDDHPTRDDQPDPRAVAIHQELFFGGPKNSDALIAALGRLGFSLSEDDLDDLLDAGEIPHVVELTYGDESLLVALDSLLEDRVFTHRVTEGEIAAGVLAIEPDLKPLMVLTDAAPFDRLEDGSPIVEVFSGESVDPAGSLRVPAGTLSAARPGDLIGVGVGAGGLRIEPIGEVAAPPADLAARVIATFGSDDTQDDDTQDSDTEGSDTEDGDDGGLPVMLDELIWRLCHDDIMAFVEPLPPLTELLDSWGLVRSGDLVAPAGFDFSTWGVGPRLAELARNYELTDRQAAAVLVVRSVFLDVLRMLDEQLFASEPDVDAAGEPDVDAAGEPDVDASGEPDVDAAAGGSAGPKRGSSDLPLELADAAVAEAVFWETVGEGVKEAVALGTMVESWEPHATRRVRPALAWLRGKSLERLGSVLQAEAAFDESLSLDPTFVNAVIDMARYATDRGDAARAISLLERAGFSDDDPIVAQLRAYLPVERTDVGRNDPCWCGSGRKYKRCHLGRAELGPSEQAGWLYEKVVHFAHDAPQGELLLELAAIRAAALAGDPVAATSDRAVLDVTLFEGGVLAGFLKTRGMLLPAAEQILAAAWLLVERSVFEVIDTRPGTGVTLQDLRTGDTHDVPDVMLSRSVKKGDLACTRLLPVGDSVEIHSSVEPVPLHLLDRTLEVLGAADTPVDPFELITVLSARFAPPRLTTGEGDPLVLCAAEFEITPAGIDHVVAVLSERFETSDEPAALPDTTGAETRPISHWNVTTPASIGSRILASLTLTETRLQVTSSSERRFEEAMAVVRAADPAARVLSETRTPFAQVAAQRQSTADSTEELSPFADPTDPAIAEALAEVTADYENRWLDMDLPALAGLTPRQAAGDPTRREDLLRLLSSFEGFPSGPGTMDVSRLRAALKL